MKLIEMFEEFYTLHVQLKKFCVSEKYIVNPGKSEENQHFCDSVLKKHL